HQALALCEQGEVGRGLLWLARSLELATDARSEGLDRPIRINLADWAGQLSRPGRLRPMRHSAPILGRGVRRQGQAVVSVGTDGVARVWDTANGREVERGPSPCDEAGRSRWWDLTAHKGLEGSPGRRRRGNATWALSADGRTVVIGDRDRLVRRW